MIINLKYHIASLAAVFLALGLGVLIGGAVPGDGVLVDEQQRITGKLEIQIEKLRQKNDILQSRIDTLESDNNIMGQFERQVLPVLVSGRLNGHSIGIIDTGGGDLAGELADSLTAAGSSVNCIISMGGLRQKDAMEICGMLGWECPPDNTFLSRLSMEISRSIAEGDCNIIDMLADAGVIKARVHPGSPVTDLVVIGGRGDKGQQKTFELDQDIVDCLGRRNISVYGVERSSDLYSSMEEYQRLGIATVDNIDTIAGQVALVYSISGQPGNYGIKPTARSLVPVPEKGVAVYAGQ
ncbi:MAG: copper transporter [Bacillota bacterium]